MKLNISYPANGSQKLIEVEDERKLRVFMDKRMGNEVPADSLGDEWKGYVRHTRKSSLQRLWADRSLPDCAHHWRQRQARLSDEAGCCMSHCNNYTRKKAYSRRLSRCYRLVSSFFSLKAIPATDLAETENVSANQSVVALLARIYLFLLCPSSNKATVRFQA